MKLELLTFQNSPLLIEQLDSLYSTAWPKFTSMGEAGALYWGAMLRNYPDFQFFIVDHSGVVVVSGNSIPFFWDGINSHLPSGWDDLLKTGVTGAENNIKPNTLGGISITVNPNYRGLRLGEKMINAMKSHAKAEGFSHAMLPVRPILKHLYPLISMDKYIQWKNEDGSPFDPWIRAHWKAGAEIVAVAQESMRVAGTVANWEEWTGMRFPESGEYVVPSALNPIAIDVDQDTGIYVEPNVWMKHRI